MWPNRDGRDPRSGRRLMETIAAVVITKNEAARLAPCLSSLAWADEIVVLDAFSDDNTTGVAREFTDKVYVRQFTDFPAQRNAAMALATTDWVCFVDADEQVNAALAGEIRSIVERGPSEAGFWLPRRNYILGKWVRHGGWYPDYQLRLLRRQRARYDESQRVHEVVVLDGLAGYLQHPLIHHNYVSWQQLFAKQRAYASLQARTLHEQGSVFRRRSFVGQPVREFGRRFIQFEGYKDGWMGLALALVLAWYQILVYREVSRLRQLDPVEQTPSIH